MNQKLPSLPLNSYPRPYINSAAAFANIAHQDWAIFLDSGAYANHSRSSKNADFDVLAIQPFKTLVFDNDELKISTDGNTQTHKGDPFELLKQHLPKLDKEFSDTIDIPYLPGAMGYFSYDLARQVEHLPELATDDEQLPQMAIGIYSVVVVVDHAKRATHIVTFGNDEHTKQLLSAWDSVINLESSQTFTSDLATAKVENSKTGLKCEAFKDSLDQEQYDNAFRAVRNYIIEGDCYQVNLTKRFSASVTGDAWATYQYLRILSPAPYGAYLNLPFAQVLSNSPESFIQCRQSNVVTSPIKGTDARDHSDKRNDADIAKSLRNSLKDRAENLMIVDLMRNDLSKTAELGSVKVPLMFEVHSFANVHHLISTITSKLKEGLHSLDLLKSCFPGGSITGAPKIRSMEIIEELEPNRRGLYCGSIAYVGLDGSLETNIAIRTIVVKDGVARFSAGGGLVIDSKADTEYQELLDKASMMQQALQGN